MLIAKEIQAKSIITQSKLPGIDYVVNPYTGCQFSCAYCYASFMGSFVNEPISNWGNYLYVKVNAIDCFAKEYQKLKPRNGTSPTLLLSSVTDAYQTAEKQHRLTRGILEILFERQYQGRVSILTKSPLVLRDIDLLAQLYNVEVGITVTATDDQISKHVEMSAPSAGSRIKTLGRLVEEGIQTYAFIGPLLPHYRYAETELRDLIKAIAETGVTSVYVEHINLSDYILERLQPVVRQCSSQIQYVYKQAKFIEHRKALDKIIYPLLEQYGLNLRLNKTLYHPSKNSHEKDTVHSRICQAKFELYDTKNSHETP